MYVQNSREFNKKLENSEAEPIGLADQRANALAISEALYRSLIDHLPLYVNRKDLHGRFTFVNDSFCSFFGKRQEEVLGKTNYDIYPPEVAEKYKHYDQWVIDHQTIYHSLEQLQAFDGTSRHLEMLKAPVRSATGEIIEIQTVYLDVTKRIETERKLAQAERLAAIGNMVAGVAHESRNALQQIQACIGLMRMRSNLDDETEALLTDLQKAQEHLHRLFDDLRGYAAPETLEIQDCDVRSIVDDSWAALLRIRDGRDVTIRQCGTNVDTYCRGDPMRLEQIFQNILQNALEACTDSAILEIEYTSTKLNNAEAICISIRDNGPGFTPDQIKRAFDPFYTTKSEGTGLGLAIVKRIVEAHQGQIEIGNCNPHGAEIRVTLLKENL